MATTPVLSDNWLIRFFDMDSGSAAVFSMNPLLPSSPDTLKSRVVGHVGRDRKTYSYAYRIAIAPPWIYAAVGEMPWELAALSMKTGKSKPVSEESAILTTGQKRYVVPYWPIRRQICLYLVMASARLLKFHIV